MEMQLLELLHKLFYAYYTTRLNVCGCELPIWRQFALIFTHSFNHIQILFHNKLLSEIKNVKEHLISRVL